MRTGIRKTSVTPFVMLLSSCDGNEKSMKLKGYGVLQVEPTDHCNLQCKMCRPHHDKWDTIHGISKGFLSVKIWENIVKGFVSDDVEFDHIIFQWLGDPLLHPNIDRLISIAQQNLSNRVNYLRIDSNMILLDDKRIKRIINSCVQNGAPLLMVASIDAFSPKVYEEVKGKDALNVVRRNLRRLIQLRNQAGPHCPINIQLQFVVQPGNAHETTMFLTYWADLLNCQGGQYYHDEIMFKRLSVDGGAAGQAAADQLYVESVQQKGITAGSHGYATVCIWEDRPWQRDDQHQTQRQACPGLWYTPVIRHDGSLIMCCADLKGDLCLGSLQENGFLDLWNGQLAQQKRTEHLAGKFTGVCNHCGGINWYSLPNDVESKMFILSG
jgi:hypothetical protein